MCAICLVEYEEGDEIKALTCSGMHHFHAGCVTEWLRLNAICPYCRAPLGVEEASGGSSSERSIERRGLAAAVAALDAAERGERYGAGQSDRSDDSSGGRSLLPPSGSDDDPVISQRSAQTAMTFPPHVVVPIMPSSAPGSDCC